MRRIDQLIPPPCFLKKYKQWWAKEKLTSVVDLEFTVLLVRICSYALQFLPSPAYTIDKIRGMFLADIRNACDDVGDNLATICVNLNVRGCLPRVLHLCFAGLKSRCEGKTNTFWEALGSAILVAQRVGIHRDAAPSLQADMHEGEKDMRHKTFCNLYIWDRYVRNTLELHTAEK